MPHASFKLLVRPNPGGLEDHRRYVTGEAKEFLQNNQFTDLVMTSDDGVSVFCHQALVVSRSTLLRSICHSMPHHPGVVTSLHIAVPVSGPTLLTIQELLYTGQVSRTRAEIDAVSQGLATLGIDNFSPVPTSTAAMASVDKKPAAVISSRETLVAADPVVAMQQFLGQTAAGPSLRNKAAAELLVHRLDPAQITVKIKRDGDGVEANNNVVREETKINMEDRNPKRKRASEGENDQEQESEEIRLDGSPVTEEIERGGGVESAPQIRMHECEDCGTQLRSAWHRHPTRHDCVRLVGVRCPECDAALRSAWFLPPSRHSCTAANTPGKRRRLTGEAEAASSGRTGMIEEQDGFVTPSRSGMDVGNGDKYFSCPLKQCSRKCETKKLLMLHLAMSHFLKKMESKYISQAENGGVDGGHRKCPHCDIPQPLSKLGFIRHVAMEHGEVMETLAAEIIYGKKKVTAPTDKDTEDRKQSDKNGADEYSDENRNEAEAGIMNKEG